MGTLALPKQKFKTVFIFLDADKNASPFDILIALDVFPEASVLKYENVSSAEAEKLVHDSMFPRGSEGAQHTKLFISGHDPHKVNDILEAAKKCMFPPFELSIIVDPGGAYTTASAAVAKMLRLFEQKNHTSIKGKNAAVLAGTGPTGQTAAKLFAVEKAQVTITSRSLEKAVSVAAEINGNVQDELVRGVEAKTEEDVSSIANSMDVIFAAGASGTRLFHLNMLSQPSRKSRIVADANAIPPLGIEGLKPDDDGTELLPSTFGVGALAIGKLKNKVEALLIRRATEEPKGIFDNRMAYEIARKIVSESSDKGKRQQDEPYKSWLP
jgi:methylene-tetrahydromethanopterin dehydrogenase